MKNYLFVLLPALLMGLGACRDKDTSPDLTSSLVAQLPATYLVTGVDGKTLSGANATVEFERKSNDKLLAKIKINDGQVQVDDRLEITVMAIGLEGDGLRLPGLKSRYQLSYTYLRNKGVSDVNLYQDGKIRGGIGYYKSTSQLVSVAFF